MKEKSIRVVVVSPLKGVEERVIKNDLETFYKTIECDYIEVARRKIGGKYYDIICDEEALLKSNPLVSAFSLDEEPMLVDSLIICNSNGENFSSLTKQDIERILKRVVKYQLLTGEKYNALLGVEY